MLAHFFQGFRILHGILLALGAVSLFALWYRTRFWLPVYAHVLAVIGLIVGFFPLKALRATRQLQNILSLASASRRQRCQRWFIYSTYFIAGRNLLIGGKRKVLAKSPTSWSDFWTVRVCIRRNGMILSSVGTQMSGSIHTEGDAMS